MSLELSGFEAVYGVRTPRHSSKRACFWLSAVAGITVGCVGGAGESSLTSPTPLTRQSHEAILAGDVDAPIVQITSPTGGETLLGRTLITVNFSSTDNVAVASHDIAISTDDGATYTAGGTGLPGTATTFQLRLPNVDTSTARVRVSAIDTSGNAGHATSGNFTIHAAPEIVSASFTGKALILSGTGFGAGAVTVTINGQDVTSEIQAQEDGLITLKGKEKKLNLRVGLNQIHVTVDGVNSNVFVWNLS